MNEELTLRDNTEEGLVAEDEAATFDPTDDLSDDDIAAALGYATTLSEPLVPQDEMSIEEGEATETADESPETEEAADEEIEDEKVSSKKPEEDEHAKRMERQDEEIRALWQEIGRLKKEPKAAHEGNTETATEVVP